MEDLLTISYRSRARLTDPVGDIDSILSMSHARNRSFQITGLLLFDGTHFLQTIEGPKDGTSSIFVKILEDCRHFDVVPFGISEIKERMFPEWTMKLIGPHATARIVPDMEEFDFSDRRLARVHVDAKNIAARSLAGRRYVSQAWC